MMNTVKRRLSSLEQRMPRVTSEWLFDRVAEMMQLAGMSFDQAFRSVVVQGADGGFAIHPGRTTRQ
jgi:hypothetical protein